MADQEVKDKEKKVDKLKRMKKLVDRKKTQRKKVEGKVKIPGVKDPKSKKIRAPKTEAKESKTGGTQAVQTGPKGGQYKIAPTGKKYYLQSEETRTFHRPVKKSENNHEIKDLVDEVVRDEKIKRVIETIKKAKPTKK